VEQQAEGIGSKAMTAQAVRGKAIFKLLNAVLARNGNRGGNNCRLCYGFLSFVGEFVAF
jgi:hypothetical protein